MRCRGSMLSECASHGWQRFAGAPLTWGAGPPLPRLTAPATSHTAAMAMACRMVSALLPTEVPNELATCTHDIWQVHSRQWFSECLGNMTYIVCPYAKGQEEGCQRSHN